MSFKVPSKPSHGSVILSSELSCVSVRAPGKGWSHFSFVAVPGKGRSVIAVCSRAGSLSGEMRLQCILWIYVSVFCFPLF